MTTKNLLSAGRAYCFASVTLLALAVGCSGGTPPTATAPSQTKAVTSSASDQPATGPSSAASPPEKNAEAAAPSTSVTSSANSTAAKPGSPETTAGASPPSRVSAKPLVPASAQEAVRRINLTKLPKLGEVREMTDSPTRVEYYAKGKVLSAAAFYRAELGQQGWQALTPADDVKTELQYLETIFSKDGFFLKLTIGQASEPDTVTVHLHSLGNIDARTLPAIAGAESMNSGLPSTASYLCQSDVATVVAEAKKLLAEHGWREYDDFGPGLPGNPQFVSLSLFQNGVQLIAFVSSTPQFQNGKPTLSYTLNGMLPFDLPTAPDAKEIKLDALSGKLEYVTGRDVPAIADFYQSAYTTLGWKSQEDKNSVGKEGALLIFERPGEAAVVLQVRHRPEGNTLVASQMLAPSRAPTTPNVATPNVTAEKPEEPAVAANPAQPLVEDAKEALKKLPSADELTNEVLKSARAEIQKALGKDVPAEVEKLLGDLGAPAGDKSRTADKSTTDKSKPTDQLTVGEEKDGFPIPKGYTYYQSEGTNFRRQITVKITSSLANVADFYDKELSGRGWKRGGPPADRTAVTANVIYTKSGGQLNVKFQRSGDEVEVTLVTRDEAAAKTAGILPRAGKSRLMLGNASDKDVTISINGTQHSIKAGKGAENPADALSLDVAAGKFVVVIQVPGANQETENLEVGVGETWGIMVLPTGGCFADRLY